MARYRNLWTAGALTALVWATTPLHAQSIASEPSRATSLVPAVLQLPTDTGAEPVSPSDQPQGVQSAGDCPSPDELEKQFEPIGSIGAGLRMPAEQVPPDCSQVVFLDPRPATAMGVEMIDFHWEPTNFFHQPLYFDDTPLERYGQSICPPLQPVISGARFFVTLPIVPYKMGVDRPYDCVTTLGKYRPGSCAPCQREVLPWFEPDAGLLQAGTVVGLVFLLP